MTRRMMPRRTELGKETPAAWNVGDEANGKEVADDVAKKEE